ncbi:protein maternal effect lethal 26-like isoform X3 [Frankliniella occidentalis]|uniref:Protein maternal effect lethal 26-like isoform X3 n=1 Tax=Frankliniella occidentalis TaxID=133901 RepID=A0A9C6WZL8_FRAOC|nr:protein maternal effect lethal 26-like isoform X3 [Frankliniella occidentalis]
MDAQRPQRHPGMRLLLLAEQTVWRDAILNKSTLYLAPLKTEDGRVSFQPVLSITNDEDNEDFVTLKLKRCVSAGVSLAHLKMIGGPTKKTKKKTTTKSLEDESHILLTKRTLPYVLSLSCEQSFEKVTILFMVYDLGSPPGAGLHLNRARLQGSHCDVKLVVEGVELAAHRAVLAVRSPVLSSMLTGDFKEAREGRAELVDASRVVVEKFLEFLYTDQIGDWGDSELELLQLADQYMVPELRAECALRLWSCEPARALEVLHAVGLSEIICGPLRQRLTAIVVDNHKVLADTPQWLEFKKTFPVLVDTMLGHKAQTSYTMASVWSL